jgi:hypothetical protein
MTRTITARAEPQGKRPGMVTFNDGTQAKFWERAPFSRLLQVGATGDCTLKIVAGKDNYPDETFVDTWEASGNAPQAPSTAPSGSGGRNSSIEAQVAAKCAAEVLNAGAEYPSRQEILEMTQHFYDAIQECQQ